MLGPLLGPALGPIAGGFISETTTWRWAFWSTTILAGLTQLLGLLFLQGRILHKIVTLTNAPRNIRANSTS
jgi:MFS family permease